jgi:integrase/recombinase XerC
MNDRIQGTSGDVLPAGVGLLDPQERVFEAMLAGWQRQQQSRNLKADTYKDRIRTVRLFQRCIDDFPWNWTPSDPGDFASTLHGRIADSTFRSYQNSVKMFNDYVCDPRYGWPDECAKRFGKIPILIFDEWNMVAHVDEFEGRPERRPLTFDELERLFNYLDDEVGRIYGKGGKGSVAALRDCALFKTTYAYGLRRREVARLQVADFKYNPHAKQYGRFGSVHVRWGKSKRGSSPQRRIVLTAPHFDWVVDVLKQYLAEVRPQLGVGNHPALFPSERANFLDLPHLGRRFQEAIIGAALPKELELHCLRHTYSTHLAEFGYDPYFVQCQLGHTYAATTGLYVHLNSDFKNSQIESALQELYGR